MAKNHRSDLGPLTTTFTPPADCTRFQFVADDALGRNIAANYYCYPSDFKGNEIVSASVIESCFPEGYASFYNRYWNGNSDIGVYSPASICPSGYTVDCAETRIKGQSHPWRDQGSIMPDPIIWSLLREGETASGCCPIGYGCHQRYPAICTSFPVRRIPVTDPIKCPGTLTPVTILTDAQSAFAMKVLVIHTAASDTATRTATSAPNDNSLSKPSQGLPLAAKIAIGVGTPLVVILAGAACFFIYRYRRKRRLLQAVQALGQDACGNRGDELETLKPELPGDAGMESVGPNDAAFRKAELDTARHGSGGAVELSAEVTGGELPELHSRSSPRELDSTSKGLSVVDTVGHNVDNQHVDERSRGLWQWSDYQD
ncbi:hypothetical protein J3E68DRAFT_449358 [Trichoderma sp. SZMC 28012]